ncbi:MAG TPA: glycosyltransferase family 39 protein [Anaeromyxobacteraceae bacterium]|nr:glycosyltransferase family 39 protein [Anaeromyxobacteraceae bacterium]
MPRPGARTEIAILAGVSLVPLALLLVASTRPPYGFFIDELYFLACSRRLALGYVDQPPLSIALLAASRWLLGDSVLAVRVLPALATAGTTFAAGLVARELGGTLRAMVLAALATAGMPVLLVFGSFFSMNALEPLLWTLVLLLVVRLVAREEPWLWLPAGILVGLGLESKHTLVLHAGALLVGMLATPVRRHLRSRWFALGCLAAALLVLPNALWQVAHGFPSLELYRNSMGTKNIDRTAWEVVRDQVLYAGPLALPLWGAGVAWLARGEGGRWRFLALTWLLLLLAMVAARSSRPDRIAAVYPMLFAAGGVALDRIRRPALRTGIGAAQAVLLVAGAAAAAPIFTPVLPPAAVRSYLEALGLRIELEQGKQGEPVPQWLADRLGWPELAVRVAEAVRSLPEDERREAVLVTENYGIAGALELYGPGLGLPRVFATHNSFHDWGPPPGSTRTYVAVGVNPRGLEGKFDSVSEVAVATCADCTRPQRRVPIVVARGPRFSVAREWPGWKTYQ